MNPFVLTVDDLPDAVVQRVLRRATEHSLGSIATRTSRPRVVGLVFLETSLRTRVGFAVAAYRLGWQAIDVLEQRSSPVSMAEAWEDTLRTVSGYVDVTVARVGRPLERSRLLEHSVCPLLNGGDTGPRAEHPSQALIDTFAMEKELGPSAQLRIAICGDLRMRAVRSLLSLLARHPPRRLVLTTFAGLGPQPLPARLVPVVEERPPWQLDDIDVLYVAGIPHGVRTEEHRTALRVDADTLAGMPSHAIVLSPMPVIDEIDPSERGDKRMRMFQQSDRGLYVRMALLEELVNATG